MKKTLIYILLFNLLIPQISLAVDFNPNYIISDETLQNKDTMSTSDIQIFLEEKNSPLASFITEYIDGNRQKASAIIYNSAQKYNINPKYLLVKLQKEQSLVTDKNPSQKQFDWATGYAVCDSCAMDDPSIQEYKGFTNQVDSAAGVMRSYYEKYPTQAWIKRAGQTYNIDGQKITPATNATAFLYTYTPHIHGNQNFWTIWQSWFEQSYPDGTLAKTNENPTVYLLQDGKKRKIDNMTSLVTRFDPKMIITVPQSEIDKLENGKEIKLPNYAIVQAPSGYYLLDYDYKRKFDSYDVVRKFGYNPDEIIEVEESDLESYLPAENISADVRDLTGRIVKLKNTQNFYYIKDNTYSPILDQKIIQTNFNNLDIETVESTTFDTLTKTNPILPKDGIIIGVEGDSSIYVIENGKKRHIKNEKTFNTYGYNWKNIVWINFYAGLAIPDGLPLQLIEEIDNLDTVTN
ncbi:MAG: hypothetical protein WC070_01540 [Candidatus Magasanikbacteria bacterium]